MSIKMVHPTKVGKDGFRPPYLRLVSARHSLHIGIVGTC
jgi:hypothetical protein